MNKKLNVTALMLTAAFFISCAAPEKQIITAPAISSLDHHGKAVITEIRDTAGEPGKDTAGYQDIYFRFTASDQDAAENYLCKKCADLNQKLFYDNRESFHKNWIARWNIKPGNEYPAIRHELLKKDGTPAVSFEILLEPEK